MTIYEIKRQTAETAPYFFTRETMRFFGQRMKDFNVKKHVKNGVNGFLCSAPRKHGKTEVFFNPTTKSLEIL